MANLYSVTEICRVCYGSGVEKIGVGDDSAEQPCSACGEVGKRTVLTIDLTDLEDKINDISDKLDDIKEKLDEL